MNFRHFCDCPKTSSHRNDFNAKYCIGEIHRFNYLKNNKIYLRIDDNSLYL